MGTGDDKCTFLSEFRNHLAGNTPEEKRTMLITKLCFCAGIIFMLGLSAHAGDRGGEVGAQDGRGCHRHGRGSFGRGL